MKALGFANPGQESMRRAPALPHRRRRPRRSLRGIHPWQGIPFGGLVLLVAGGVSGCVDAGRSGSGPAVAAFVQHDSAGIMVAEAGFPDWGGTTPWRVEATPIFEVGGDAAEGDEAFAEMSGALLLPDGHVIVADPGRALVFRFSEDGLLLGSFGGPGDGPGELGGAGGFGGMGFGTGLGLDRLDDGTLLVLDQGLGVHAFDADGGFLRLERGSGTVGGVNLNTADVRTVLRDGTLVLSSVDPRAGRREVGVVPPESRSFQRLGGMEFAVPEAVGGRTVVGSPFVARGAVAVRSGPSPAIFISAGQEPEIRVLDLEGQLTRILRYGLEQPDTRDFLPEIRASLEAGAGDAEGKWLGTVTVPMSPMGDLLEVGPDRILVRDRGALGSHVLRVHHLHR